MKKILIYLFVLLGMVLMDNEVLSQQMPVSINQIFRPRLWNPASMGSKEYNNVFIAHQQRKMLLPGMRSISQFLNYNSLPLGRHQNFGWGLMVSNDIEHTENRFAFSGSVAVQAIKTDNQRLSLGISAGLINWNSRYDQILVFNRDDILLQNSPTNFAELDAGLGVEYAVNTKKLDIQLGAAASQLPKNLISTDLLGISLFPHLNAGGRVLFQPVHNFKIGPLLYYKDVFLASTEDTIAGTTYSYGIQKAQMDVGILGRFDRQNMWVGGSYTINKAALNFNFGMQVFVSDTAKNKGAPALFVDFNSGFSYPMQTASVFGPSIEIGLDISFGQAYKYKKDRDSVKYYIGAFWADDGNLNRHLEKKLAPTGPYGLSGETFVNSKTVTLNYRFPDISLQYLGTTPDFEGDSLLSVGMEWIGVDGFLQGIVYEVIKEALTPDTINFLNPEEIESLDGIIFIELSADLKSNEAQANQRAEGMIYEGEFGTNNEEMDTLFVPVVYNDADTLMGIAKGRYVSNLQLAVLKLYAMRAKLAYDLQKAYGDQYFFIFEGAEPPKEKILDALQNGLTVVKIKKPRITPNHPHQESFQENIVTIKFDRTKDNVVTEVKDGKEEDIILDNDRRLKKKNRRQKVRDKVK